jgi:hypothetical protein
MGDRPRVAALGVAQAGQQRQPVDGNLLGRRVEPGRRGAAQQRVAGDAAEHAQPVGR